jgi:hypothetical protein
VLSKVVNFKSTATSVKVIDNIGIFCNTGSPAITFAGAVNYYNLLSLYSLVDFTDNSNYRFVRVNSVTLSLERAVDEVTMATMVTGNFIYLDFYPELFSTTLPVAGPSRDQYAYKIDTMTFNRQSYICPMIDCQLYDTQVAPILVNPSKSMLYGEVQYLPGQFSVVSDKTINAPATQKLFNLTVCYNLTFFGRT